jgi:FkbM family methyltransferase
VEPLTHVRPRGCSFDLEVPSRNSAWYVEAGYEPFSTAIFRSACRVADVVVDVGAHVGYYSCLASSTNAGARVLAVEASPANAQVAERNAASNGVRVEFRHAAFGQVSGQASFEITEASDNCGLSGHPNSPSIERITLAAITGRDLGIDPGKRLVLKIDVEGHELSVLEGFGEVVAEAADVRILVEFNPKCILSAGGSPGAVLRWLADHDFRVFALDEGSFRWSEVSDDSLIEHVGHGYVNLWCIPRSRAVVVCAVMHSARLAGAERSHVEFVEDLIGAGGMIHTIMPLPDGGLFEQARSAGSSASLVGACPWWVTAESQPDAAGAERQWQENLVSREVVGEVSGIDPDVVLSQSIVVPQGALAALILGKPHVWWIREFVDLDHGLRLPLPPQQAGQLVAGLSNAVLTNSAAVRRHFFPFNPDAASVVHPCPRLAAAPVIGLGWGQALTLGIIASLQAGKGHAAAIEALAELAGEGLDVRLACFGDGSPVDLDRLRRLAAELGVLDRVVFAGHVADRASVYGMVDVVAVTSLAEAFGRVPFEATDAGRPVIYARSGGIVEHMQDGQTGLAFSPGNAHEFAQAVKSLVADPDLASRLVHGARDHLHQLRSDPSRAERLLETLRGAMDKPPDGATSGLAFWLAKSALAAAAARDAAFAARDASVAERDAAVAARDAAVAARDAAVAERDSMRRSRAWRLLSGSKSLAKRLVSWRG